MALLLICFQVNEKKLHLKVEAQKDHRQTGIQNPTIAFVLATSFGFR